MSLKKLNKLFRNQNQKGFSLVELMIALTILAFFAVGIVAAFSGAFQAMADSKYRTVATNLAQEALEDVHNLENEEYPFFRTYDESKNGMDYIIQVVAYRYEDEDEDGENYAEVTATVEWYDRKGVRKFVQLLTNVYNLSIDKTEKPQEIESMSLVANPEKMICCQNDQISTITAEVFAEGDVRFAVTGTPVEFSVNEGGVLSSKIALTDTIGRATTELTIKDGYEKAEVTAKCGPLLPKTVTVTCKAIPKTIILSAEPSIVAPGKTSLIKATVQDSCGENLSEETGEVEVIFETDYGAFDSDGSKEMKVNTEGGIARVELSGLNNGQKATVTGKVTLDEDEDNKFSNTTTVNCTNYEITVDPKNATIIPGETVKITATLKEGDSHKEGQNIKFISSAGVFLEPSTMTDWNGEAWVTLSGLTGGTTATVTASFIETEQDITISDISIIKCKQYKLTIIAEDEIITPNGTSVITAKLTDYQDNPIANRGISFSTDRGSIDNNPILTDSNGIAKAILKELKNSDIGHKATVTATIEDESAEISVECKEFIYKLDISANTPIYTIENSVITATLKNYLNDVQKGKPIKFTTTLGTLTKQGVGSGKTITVNTNDEGIAKVELSHNSNGTAKVTATYQDAEANVSVNILSLPRIKLWTNTSGGNYISLSSSGTVVTFDLTIENGSLTNINKVIVSWNGTSPQRYTKIEIKQPRTSTSTSRTIYTNTQNNNNKGSLRNLTQSFNMATNNSTTGTTRVAITFNNSIYNKNISVIFNPDDYPNATNYHEVTFNTPNK